MSYVVAATYESKPGREADLEVHLNAMIAPTRAEEGSAEYRIFRSRDDDRVFFLFERYRTPADFDVHKESEHFEEHIRNGAWECLESRSVVFCEEIGE